MLLLVALLLSALSRDPGSDRFVLPVCEDSDFEFRLSMLHEGRESASREGRLSRRGFLPSAILNGG